MWFCGATGRMGNMNQDRPNSSSSKGRIVDYFAFDSSFANCFFEIYDLAF